MPVLLSVVAIDSRQGNALTRVESTLAWDPGTWVDPQSTQHDANPIPASSVPYFAPECGERFRDASEYPAAFARFWEKLPRYTPREFVRRELSFEGSAQLYLSALERAARM